MKKLKTTVKKYEMYTDYNACSMTKLQTILYALGCMTGMFVISFIFFQNIVFCVLTSFPGLLFMKTIRHSKVNKRKNKLLIQFKDMLYSLSSSLSAGNSVESAFVNCVDDLSYLYPDKNTDIIRELNIINNKIHMNVPVEEALSDFAKRSHLEDIQNFADVFDMCKRTSGNVREVIKSTTTIISEKIETKQEIDTMLAEKKLESRLVTIMPLAVISLIELTNSEYMQPVFTQISGRVAMMASLLLILTAFFGAQKIMKIEV